MPKMITVAEPVFALCSQLELNYRVLLAYLLRVREGMNVLIVDDDASTLALLHLELSRNRFNVTTASDESSALKALKENDFDWLLVDGQMPVSDGFQIAAKAKQIQPKLKIAMISGIYENTDIQGHPIERLFTKPIDTDLLASYLSQ